MEKAIEEEKDRYVQVHLEATHHKLATVFPALRVNLWVAFELLLG